MLETSKRRVLLMAAGAGTGIVLLVLIVLYVATGPDKEHTTSGIFLDFGKSKEQPGIYQHAAIATDSPICAQTAMEIARKPNATTMDAALAGLICNSVVHPHNMGIGGGFVMVIYDEKTGRSYALNAREVAPLASTQDMYHGKSEDSILGARAIAVPGELYGYHLAHLRFGGLPWRDLFQPAIQMLEYGVPIGPFLAHALKENAALLERIPEFDTFTTFNGSGGGRRVLEQGEVYRDPILAHTFRQIAELGYQEFYTGATGNLFLEELVEKGGIVTSADLSKYRAEWVIPLHVQLGGSILYSLPPPASGALLGYILNIMDSYNYSQTPPQTEEEELLMWHRFVEAMKWAYARRTEVGDPADEGIKDSVNKLTEELISEEFAAKAKRNTSDERTSSNPADYGAQYLPPPDDHGTSHLSIHGADGLSISVTSTINHYFGAKVRSPSTGIIFNNEMDDFSYPDITSFFGIPPSQANLVAPGKRPLSSMCPAIFVDSHSKRSQLIIGAAGGTRITTSVAYPSLRYLWLKQSLKESIDAARFHHQLTPMSIAAEKDLPQHVEEYFRAKGHTFSEFGRSSTVAVARTPEGTLHAMYDYRKPASVSGY